MTIKGYEKTLNEIAPDILDGWRVVHLSREDLLIMRNGFIELTIYDLYSGAWIEPSHNSTLFANGRLDRTIRILQATHEFIENYED